MLARLLKLIGVKYKKCKQCGKKCRVQIWFDGYALGYEYIECECGFYGQSTRNKDWEEDGE